MGKRQNEGIEESILPNKIGEIWMRRLMLGGHDWRNEKSSYIKIVIKENLFGKIP